MTTLGSIIDVLQKNIHISGVAMTIGDVYFSAGLVVCALAFAVWMGSLMKMGELLIEACGRPVGAAITVITSFVGSALSVVFWPATLTLVAAYWIDRRGTFDVLVFTDVKLALYAPSTENVESVESREPAPIAWRRMSKARFQERSEDLRERGYRVERA